MARSYRAEPSINKQRKTKAYKRQSHGGFSKDLGDYIAY